MDLVSMEHTIRLRLAEPAGFAAGKREFEDRDVNRGEWEPGGLSPDTQLAVQIDVRDENSSGSLRRPDVPRGYGNVLRQAVNLRPDLLSRTSIETQLLILADRLLLELCAGESDPVAEQESMMVRWVAD